MASSALTVLLSLSLSLGMISVPPQMGVGKKKDSILDKVQKRCQVAEKTALVVLLSENGGQSPGARFMVRWGKSLIEPFVGTSYRTRIWLTGKEATPEAFLAAIRKAARNHEALDIILFTHGNRGYIRLGKKKLTGPKIVKGLKNRGGKKVRMLYMTCCYSDSLLKYWKKAGIQAYRGHSGVYRPLAFPAFLYGWLKGETYQEASRREFAMNRFLHDLFNNNYELVCQIVDAMEKVVKSLPGQTSPGQKAKTIAREIISIAQKWCKNRWNLEESRPHLRGNKQVRIDRLPGRGSE